MTQKRANFEIFLLIMRFIRSIFFNLFMMGLGFFLGAGFCMGVMKARTHIFQSHNRELCQKTGGNCELCSSNQVRTVTVGDSGDGKQDF